LYAIEVAKEAKIIAAENIMLNPETEVSGTISQCMV